MTNKNNKWEDRLDKFIRRQEIVNIKDYYCKKNLKQFIKSLLEQKDKEIEDKMKIGMKIGWQQAEDEAVRIKELKDKLTKTK